MPTLNLDYTKKLELLHELEDLGHDYKASVVAAELSGRGIPEDTFFFRNQSTFRRAVANDVEKIFWNNGEDDREADHLVFDLNREGIYDMLPEAIVHSQGKRKRTDEAPQKLGQELRRQERDARKFFSPLENEFHHRSLKLDIIERELLKNNNLRRNRQFFNYFFEDSSALSDQQLLVLLHILPLSHKIRGDMELIGLTLSRILNYKVAVTSHWNLQVHRLEKGSAPTLGEGTLGTDTVLNDWFCISNRRYEVRISDVPASTFGDFRAKGRHTNVLNYMLPYFFAADAEYSIVLLPTKEDSALKISDDTAVSFLGFNSYI
jgi:type VI secretion system protein ImpH